MASNSNSLRKKSTEIDEKSSDTQSDEKGDVPESNGDEKKEDENYETNSRGIPPAKFIVPLPPLSLSLVAHSPCITRIVSL